MTPDEIVRYINNHSGDDRMDAAETATLARELDFVKSKTYDVKYPGMKAKLFIPVSNEADPGADSIVYHQWDEYGMAKIISNYADDLPMVDAVAKEFSNRVKSLATSYQFSIQDLRSAARRRKPLDASRASAARRAIERGFDEIAAFGVPEAGIGHGFVNNPNVSLVAPNVGAWASATAAEMLDDMRKLVSSIVTTTNSVHAPDTLLLDTASYELFAGTVAGANIDSTPLSAFLRTNPHIKNVDSWHVLDTADAAGTGPRAVAYLRDPEVLQLEIPQEFEQLPPQARNLAFVIACHARCAGTVIRYPLAMAYMDNL